MTYDEMLEVEHECWQQSTRCLLQPPQFPHRSVAARIRNRQLCSEMSRRWRRMEQKRKLDRIVKDFQEATRVRISQEFWW